jgi:two-component system, NarL family, nitrate/nitrite sensor histidine kinase NarX
LLKESLLTESLPTTSSTSLIARVGQIMTVIIMLGLFSMISSMLVTESLSGDASKINNAGALRMQAMRISRAYFADHTHNNQLIVKETKMFDRKLALLMLNERDSTKIDSNVAKQYQKVLLFWQQLRHKKNHRHTVQEQIKIFEKFDHFVLMIDQLVSLLQQESEKKLNILRLIQGGSLLSVIIVTIIILLKLNKSLIIPLKQLVKVANETGKGNFDLKAQYNADDELGVLANAINQMSSELKATYQDFEQRVAQKTILLTQSNQSLAVLYRAAKQLTSYDSQQHNLHDTTQHNLASSRQEQQIDQKIITELEQVLGFGKISIKLHHHHKNNHLLIDIATPFDTIDNICFNHLRFPLEKHTLLFGYLVWQFPKGEQVEARHKQILQAMADIIATAIELDQKRNTENRLIIVEERAVIARELHDSLAQSLSYLKVQMSLLTRKMQKNSASGQIEASIDETISDIKQGLNSAYLQLRELLTTFRLKLEDPSLENALQGTVTEFAEKCQHPIILSFKLPHNYLSANQEIHLLQIIREALANVHRHAKATKAGVSIKNKSDTITVKIWDNGQGLPEVFPEQGHFGLGIMEERAKSLNSIIELVNREPQGTQVILTFNK